MSNTNLTPYETLELKELLDTEVISFKKIHASMPIAQDDELENFMKRSLDTKKKSIASIRDFINSSINADSNNNNNSDSNNKNNSNDSDSSDSSNDTSGK